MLDSLDSKPSNRVVYLLTLAGIVLFLVATLVMGYYSNLVVASGAGYGVMDIEFAWTAERMQVIRDALAAAGGLEAEIAVNQWDYLYMPGYALLIYGLYTIGVRNATNHPTYQAVNRPLTLLAPLAAGFDVFENVFILQMLTTPDPITQTSVTLMEVFCVTKWVLLLVAIVGGLVALAVGGLQKLRGRNSG